MLKMDGCLEPINCFKEFNKALKLFMRELIKVYPDISELKLMFSIYKMMKTINKKSPQRYFHELIAPHSDDLLKKDMVFFLSKEFDDAISSKIISRLKSEYYMMNEENKDMVWKHIVVLYHLSVKCTKFDTSAVTNSSQQKLK